MTPLPKGLSWSLQKRGMWLLHGVTFSLSVHKWLTTLQYCSTLWVAFRWVWVWLKKIIPKYIIKLSHGETGNMSVFVWTYWWFRAIIFCPEKSRSKTIHKESQSKFTLIFESIPTTDASCCLKGLGVFLADLPTSHTQEKKIKNNVTRCGFFSKK